MPNIQSAKKALRQAKKRALLNLKVKNAYKQAVKAVNKGISEGKNLAEELRLAQKKLDKAAKRGVIKKNTAARKISRLMKKAKTSTK
jgi:small subunit ribosomal protein S20